MGWVLTVFLLAVTALVTYGVVHWDDRNRCQTVVENRADVDEEFQKDWAIVLAVVPLVVLALVVGYGVWSKAKKKSQ